ncbi:hypothetical protein HBI18_040060 [Parastagonospora nodorum]|nr:hypothetical protein HBI30_103520 [Parastagonospora nodorum]KAH5742399.1 hypothetical protein HBI18_040060 [Parastagonospora nodorum]
MDVTSSLHNTSLYNNDRTARPGNLQGEPYGGPNPERERFSGHQNYVSIVIGSEHAKCGYCLGCHHVHPGRFASKLTAYSSLPQDRQTPGRRHAPHLPRFVSLVRRLCSPHGVYHNSLYNIRSLRQTSSHRFSFRDTSRCRSSASTQLDSPSI